MQLMGLQDILFPLLSRRGQGWSDRANFCYRSCVSAVASELLLSFLRPSGSKRAELERRPPLAPPT